MAVLDLDHRAGRAHAGMRLERPFVFGLDHACGGLERFIDIADRLAVFALAHGGLADVVVQRLLVDERRLAARPLHLELLHRLDRVPFLVGDHREEVVLPHHARARNVLDRGFVDLDRGRARDRRADHAGMHHARNLHVGDERLLAEHLGCDVGAFDRLADDLVVLRVLRLGLAGGVERIADLLVPFELDVEIAPADQLGVARLLGRVAFGVHDAVGDGELVGGKAKLLRRHLHEHPARLGRRGAHLHTAALDAGRAGGAALVHAGAGVGHVHLHPLERHVELFGHHLADRDVESLAHVHLAEEGGDRAVAVDGDVGGELVRHQRRAGALREGRVDREHGVEADRHADRHDHGAGALEHRAAGERGEPVHLRHDRLPQPIIVAARLTARRMFMWVPQRHLSPSSACLICASVGFLLSRRNAAAVMIQPLMQ